MPANQQFFKPSARPKNLPHILFAVCKRYRGSVGPVPSGTFAGLRRQGLLITTGSFTVDAKQEATCDGAPPVDLIDGERLCDLLKEHKWGEASVWSRMSKYRRSSSPSFDGTSSLRMTNS
jgi:hypothetical protein